MPSKTQDEEIEVDEAPISIDPYSVLSLEKHATQDQIKTAYRKAALKYHPDKASSEDKETAHAKFQEIAFAYAILSDERRRRRYDTTGNTSGSLELDDDFDWTTFFREQFENVVTLEAIENFAQDYKGSDEERQHVLAAYEKVQGSMDKLYEEVMLSDVLEDEDRFRRIIDAALAEGEAESYKKYTEESEAARKKRLDRAKRRKAKEAREAAKAAEDLESEGKSKAKSKKAKAGNDLGDLAALIQQRQNGRAEAFFDNLEAKNADQGKAKKGFKRAAIDEPPEDAFANNRNKGKVQAKEEATAGSKVKRVKKRA